MQKKITRQNKFAGLFNQTSFTHSIERRKDTLNKVVQARLQFCQIYAKPKDVLAQLF
jgi:hypothetical protein